MTKQELEKIVMVNLYEVEHSGHYIEHDSPYLGVSTNYSPWKHTYGPYINKSLAEAEQKKLREKCKDTLECKNFVTVKKIMIPESDLFLKNGKYYYVTEMKELGNSIEYDED